MTRITGAAPVLPVSGLGAALARYTTLGFEASAYEGGGYGFIRWDDVHLHLAQVDDIDPATSMSAVYLYVDDADALHARWSTSGVDGRFHEPVDTDYGLREGAYVDPDGNLLRFGSPSATQPANVG